jgi:hypothetical protein
MMGKPLGMASDFYRVRVVRLDESGALDLEWRDDILYRTPPAQAVEEFDAWVVQAVEMADDEAATTLRAFQTADEAHGYLEEIESDLIALTRTELEERHFPAG